MESDHKAATTLSAVALGLIGLCFAALLYEVVITRQLWQEIPRLFGGFLAPVPPAIFIAFCLAYRDSPPPAEPSPGRMGLFLALSVAITIGTGLFFFRNPSHQEISTAPAIVESAVFSASILNFLFFRSPLAAAALCGTSIGLTFFVIFLT
tara:strand:+ start:157 stop:609 length:453 start_codon:yes stop_codon:yes gene_type:complete